MENLSRTTIGQTKFRDGRLDALCDRFEDTWRTGVGSGVKALLETPDAAESFRDAAHGDQAAPAVFRASARRLFSPWLLLGTALAVLGLPAWAAVVTFRVETPAGTIVVEVDQPGVEVFVDGRRRITIRRPGEETPITIEADGERHELKLVKDGFSVYTREFMLKNKDRRAIQVSLLPKPAPTTRPAVTPPATGSAMVASTCLPPVGPALGRELGISLGEERYDNALGMKMVWCPPGKFLMGSPETDRYADRDEQPQVKVELTNGFWLGKYEVTQGEWKGLMGTEPWKGNYNVKEGSYNAATYVSWDDAQSFCVKLTERETAAGRLGSGWRYRLPSEAEWEYACRAGSVTPYGFGDDAAKLADYAWYDKNALDVNESYAHEVGRKRGNEWGLHDLHGNVWEWCGDWYRDDLAGGHNPTGPSGDSDWAYRVHRVYRGGSWYSVAAYCRSADRGRTDPSFRYFNLGFRVARVPGSPAPASPAATPHAPPTTGAAMPARTKEYATPAVRATETGTRAGEERSDNVLGMKLVWCPPGKFLMGSPATDKDAADDEKPQVEVELTNGYWLGKFEVTQGEWKALMGTEPWKGQQYVTERPDIAATYVSWDDAQSFCKKLTERDAAAGKLAGGGYRLPSEAEWEYACRAGSRARYCFGDDSDRLGKYAWYGSQSEIAVHEVGQKESNGWGLHDVHGNVWEWCGDWHDLKLMGGRNPTGAPTGSDRVRRGGGWYDESRHCRSAFRCGDGPSYRVDFLGFRVARVPGSSR